MTEAATSAAPALSEKARAVLGKRNLIFVGLMGAGKSAIGRLVAQSLSIPSSIRMRRSRRFPA